MAELDIILLYKRSACLFKILLLHIIVEPAGFSNALDVNTFQLADFDSGLCGFGDQTISEKSGSNAATC